MIIVTITIIINILVKKTIIINIEEDLIYSIK